MRKSAITRAINAFERAVEDKAMDGSIPYYSDDPQEQMELDAEHDAIKHNYIKARAKLERLLENA